MNHRAYLCLGSNIRPEENMRQAIAMLRENCNLCELQRLSNCYEVQAVGSDGATHRDLPNFLNLVVEINTFLDAEGIKTQIREPIEKALGRVRTEDKYAPRTIDLDLVVFDGQVLESNLWKRLYVALPLSELLPDLRHPQTGETLREVAERLLEKDSAVLRTL